jgi:hypothetical protein
MMPLSIGTQGGGQQAGPPVGGGGGGAAVSVTCKPRKIIAVKKSFNVFIMVDKCIKNP